MNDPRLSKDLRAALASGRRRGGRRACRVRRSPGTCSWSTRQITPACAAWSRVRSRCDGSKGLRPRVQHIVDELLDAVAAPRTGRRGRPGRRRSRSRCPFTVICELLGVPDRERASLGACAHRTRSHPPRRPTSTPRQDGRPTRSSQQLTALVRTKTRRSRATTSSSALIGARDGDGTPQPAGTALHDLPADRRGARHDRQPHREQRRRAAPPPRPARRSCASDPATISAARRGVPPLRRARCLHATFRYATENRSISAVRPFRRALRSSSTWRPPTATTDRYAHPEDARPSTVPTARHLAFGHGIHFCLGAPLARMEGLSWRLTSLLRRFPELLASPWAP